MDKQTFMQVVGRNIRLNRLSRNFPAEDLAKLLDITPGFLGLVERGHRGISHQKLHTLSLLFNVSMDTFFSDTENPQVVDPFEMLRIQIRTAVNEMSEKELRFVIQLISCLRAYKNNEPQ